MRQGQLTTFIVRTAPHDCRECEEEVSIGTFACSLFGKKGPKMFITYLHATCLLPYLARRHSNHVPQRKQGEPRPYDKEKMSKMNRRNYLIREIVKSRDKEWIQSVWPEFEKLHTSLDLDRSRATRRPIGTTERISEIQSWLSTDLTYEEYFHDGD